MDVYFIRHKMGLPENEKTLKKTLEKMWDAHVIAMDYESTTSVNPTGYSKAGEKALSLFKKFSAEGAIVAADYSIYDPTKMLIGIVEKGTHIIEEFDGDKNYKTMKLKDIREVKYLDYPVLSALRPRLTTITKWPSAKKQVKAALFEKPLDDEVTSLSPSQLEVICYEYLKHIGLIDSLLLPIGRTLPDIDIIGLDKSNNKVIAQVTFNDFNVKAKIDCLKVHKSQDVNLYFFGFGKTKTPVSDTNIRYIDIEDVYDYLKKYKRGMLNAMLCG